MSEAPPPDDTIGNIIGQVAAGEAKAATLVPDDVKALADRVELLSADFGRWESYKAASVEYVVAFTNEANWHWRIRLGVTIACGILVIFLAMCLILGVIYADRLFGKDQSHALTALIVATVSGSVIVTIAVTKGAFATMADRNAGLPMPEHMKELVEAGKNILGGGHG